MAMALVGQVWYHTIILWCGWLLVVVVVVGLYCTYIFCMGMGVAGGGLRYLDTYGTIPTIPYHTIPSNFQATSNRIGNGA